MQTMKELDAMITLLEEQYKAMVGIKVESVKEIQ
jgi:hypothetical protein